MLIFNLIFESVSTDLSWLSNLVKDDVFQKTEYDEMVQKVNSIDTSKLVKKQIMIIIPVILKIKYLTLLAWLLILLLLLLKIGDLLLVMYIIK